MLIKLEEYFKIYFSYYTTINVILTSMFRPPSAFIRNCSSSFHQIVWRAGRRQFRFYSCVIYINKKNRLLYWMCFINHMAWAACSTGRVFVWDNMPSVFQKSYNYDCLSRPESLAVWDNMPDMFQKSYGHDCSKRCEHGEVVNEECYCDPCYSSASCDLLCSDNGECDPETHTCYCKHKYIGNTK